MTDFFFSRLRIIMPSTSTKTAKPKRGMSAYMLFAREKRPEVKRANPNATFGEIAKKLGEMWRSLSPEQKTKYEKMARESK